MTETKNGTKRIQRNHRLSEECVALLGRLTKLLGVRSEAVVIEMLVRDEAMRKLNWRPAAAFSDDPGNPPPA
jgi:hypothetical protein